MLCSLIVDLCIRKGCLQVNTFFFTICITLCILLPAGSSLAESIRVAIADNQPSVTLESPAGLRTTGAPGRKSGQSATYRAADVGKKPVRVSSSGAFINVNGKAYRGEIEIRKKGNGRLLVINDLDLEAYLLGVVAAEIPSDWEMEALKAQAVASRTYALYEKQNAGRRPYHILATVDSQMYLGRRGERTRATEAVEATRDLVITYRGDVIPAFYHSSCGGHTENALELWGIDEPFLKGVDCDCQNISTYGIWEKRFTTAGVIRALRRQGFRLADIGSVEMGDLTPAGRVKNVIFRNSGRATSVPAETIRAALGYSNIPSIFFEPELMDQEVVFSGRGLGHGIGLCQWGAKEMARNGADYRAILSHYYPGTDVVLKQGR
jgi:stage II sporulation protein D